MDAQSSGTPVIVALPDEIDVTNCENVAESLADLIDKAELVIADMTGTSFCDSSGVQVLLAAHQHAVTSGCELRVVVRPGDGVARVMAIVGLDRILDIYASVQAATPTDFTAVQLTE